jgi:putative endonuclease
MSSTNKPIGGYMYILECANDSYYVGSTRNLGKRVSAHQNGLGSNYTKKHLPVRLIYFETFDKIWKAFNREKQIQRWTNEKKASLIRGDISALKELATCKNETSHKNVSFGSAQETNGSAQETKVSILETNSTVTSATLSDREG